MKSVISDQEILSGVQEVLEDSLAVESDEATPDASLIKDLGCESIDFLDIVNRLEEKFGLKLYGETEGLHDIFPSASNELWRLFDVKDAQHVLTTEALVFIREHYPLVEIPDVLTKDAVAYVFLQEIETVGYICRLIKSKLR